jgi:DnaJ-domain-containing protein 1
MALRRRKRHTGPPERENVDLEAPEHAWWAAGSTDPFARPPEPEPEPEPAAPEPEAESLPEGRDPYDVLRVAATASWDEIVASHRKLVRRWHPDGLGEGSPEEEVEFCAARMREVNEAYQALRVRRNR